MTTVAQFERYAITREQGGTCPHLFIHTIIQNRACVLCKEGLQKASRAFYLYICFFAQNADFVLARALKAARRTGRASARIGHNLLYF